MKVVDARFLDEGERHGEENQGDDHKLIDLRGEDLQVDQVMHDRGSPALGPNQRDCRFREEGHSVVYDLQ